MEIETVIALEDAIRIARSILRDHEYGYSMDDLVVEVESFMRDECFEAIRVE